MQVSQWAAHHSEENFADPEEFVPERWLDGEDVVGDGKGKGWKREEKYEGDRRGAMQPFSFGPRNCLGKVSYDFFPPFFPSFPVTKYLTGFFLFKTESRPRRNAPHHGQTIMDF